MDLALALRAFQRTVERGSMTAAARDLAVSQPAISKHLRNLEAHVGARLLERSARLVRPTPQGRRLYETSRPALSAIDAALEDARTEGAEVEGRLRLHAPTCIGAKHLHPIVADFRARHPRVTVDLVLEERVVDLIHEDYDLALRYGRPEGQNLVVRRLGWSRRILAAAPAYLERIGGIEAPEQLAGAEFVAIASAATGGDALALQHGGETVTVPIRPVLRTNNAEVLVAALRAGRVMGPVQHLLVAEDLAEGRLVRVLPNHAIRATEASLVFPSVRHMRPAVRAFTDFAVPRIRAIEGISQTT
ncbi:MULTISPECIES: LysR family transcriptional regulator [Methylobacterium]|uniref:HTH-type transcriptional regulator DmlR n=2 Tax=Pseudomonadota TaxID=1224 RepID=A0ABQ4SSM7_9HYPH|nr:MULTISPECIES: LysR family transcriptional regulator [Methylobacterium]PIU05328.1 MAG: LysR family transcriptional regulator [Methylobacterium sp. CG09_land_8_20_14_0_10_71_15]PIU12210.1 MAG: LysR family transcriptional regulator [Methylobacterium sp. CG08_land_8_20_14_0_20_71_15]GJE06210.1 HTH-type transcriptional regulator DmlR [Methylobacterium jeotgali]